jgi:asparagine synthase (glutamine-hydrolysing)
VTGRVAGVVGRSAPSAAARIRRRYGASTIDEPSLVLGFRGPPPARRGSVLCVLDGAIQDVDELAAELGEPAGDPQALLAIAWSRWGAATFERLRGEWGAVLWDAAGQRGVATCDRLGCRALYYSEATGALVFASQLQDVLSTLPTRPPPDTTSLSHWLAGGGPPAGRTLYDGVRRLGGGRLLSFGQAGVEVTAWWRPQYRDPVPRSRAEAGQELRGHLERSLARCRAEADATGVLLSGGLDSGAVAALLTDGGRRAGGRAYSAVFPGLPTVDERPLIDELADAFGLTSVRVEADVGPLLGAGVAYLLHCEVPPSSPNLFFWLPLLRRAADDGTAILIDGEGGDELYGVARYLLADLVRRGRPLAALRLARRFPNAGDHPPWRPVLRVTRDYGLLGAMPAGLHAAARRLRSPGRQAPFWLAPDAARAYIRSDDPWAWARGQGPRWWLGLLEALTSADGAVLARDHVRARSAMAGLEPRHPLLDADVVDFMLGVDPRHAFGPHLSRPLLREAVRGLLPDVVRLRGQKSTFDALFHRSLAGPESERIRRLLTGPSAEVRPYVDDHALRTLVGPNGWRAAGGVQRWGMAVWRMVTAELFLRHQAGGDLSAELVGEMDLPSFPIVERSPLAAR